MRGLEFLSPLLMDRVFAWNAATMSIAASTHGIDLEFSWCLRVVETSVEARTMESVLESHGPCESLELSIVRLGLETSELRVDNDMQIDTVVGDRSLVTTLYAVFAVLSSTVLARKVSGTRNLASVEKEPRRRLASGEISLQRSPFYNSARGQT